MTYQCVCKKSNTTCTSSGAGTAYYSVIHHRFYWDSVARPLVFCVFVDRCLSFWPLYFLSPLFTASDHRRSWHGITTTPLFNILLSYLFSITLLYFFILTCSCPYSYNLMLTTIYMCRHVSIYTGLILSLRS